MDNQLLFLAGLLLIIGLFAILSSKNMIRIIIGIEILLNAAIILIISNTKPQLFEETAVFVLFMLAFTVIVSSIALAVLFKLNRKGIDIQNQHLTQLKD